MRGDELIFLCEIPLILFPKFNIETVHCPKHWRRKKKSRNQIGFWRLEHLPWIAGEAKNKIKPGFRGSSHTHVNKG